MSANLKPQIFDVNAANFEQEVVQASQERVIVVDFWAPWCGPCRTLGPALEEVVVALGPGVALAKVNVDENPELAQIFRVQGIPAVKILKEGRLVQEFTGALPKAQIEALLKPLVPQMPRGEGEEDEGEDLVQGGKVLLEEGDLEGAAQLFEEKLAAEADDNQALLGLARVRLHQGDFEAVRQLAERIEEGSAELEQAQALVKLIDIHQLAGGAGGRAAAAGRLLADPEDLEARYLLACCAAAEGDYATALREWLTIVERRRDFRQGAAREGMAALFHLLGRQHPAVGDYPQRLYRALY
ncbi:MAG: tetratricopeptide repeat protein [Candidatus Handelsmanbacteria bacterium]|nr:tetratricopeptide repeat protein [Candidatus Handelsmanbacteria bacterium]